MVEVTFVASKKGVPVKCQVDGSTPLADLTLLAKQQLELQDSDSDKVKLYHDNGTLVEEDDASGTVKGLSDGVTIYASKPSDHGTEELVIRLCILGPGAVGKSALTLRYTNDHFHEEYDPTIEDAYRKTVRIDGKPATLDILDTAGQEDFTALRNAWYRNKDGFLLIYSLMDPKSLEELQGFHEQLQEFYEGEGEVPPVLLVGNKADLNPSFSPKEAADFAQSEGTKTEAYGAIGLIKTSAKTGQNVEAAFASIVRAVRRKQGREGKKKSSWSKCSIL